MRASVPSQRFIEYVRASAPRRGRCARGPAGFGTP